PGAAGQLLSVREVCGAAGEGVNNGDCQEVYRCTTR
ncbi:hypothetical protein Tco_0632001, partial [Tanacetum coccineum]